MSDRLTGSQVSIWAHEPLDTFTTRDPAVTVLHVNSLAREVQASRKLIADLRALHRSTEDAERVTRCRWCRGLYPCPTIRMIDEAGL